MNLAKKIGTFFTINLLVFSLNTSPIWAQQESLNLNGVDTTNYMDQVNLTFNGQTMSNVYTGAITGSLGGVSGYFFCYDLNNIIDVPGNYTVNLLNPTASFPSYLQLPSTFNLQVASSLLNSLNIPSLGNKDQYAGLQLAIWSVLYNWTSTSQSLALNGANFSSTVTGDALVAANTFLNDAYNLVQTGNYTNTGSYQLLVNANDSLGNVTQTLVGVGAPEPMTYLIMGSMLALVAILAYQKQKSKKIA